MFLNIRNIEEILPLVPKILKIGKTEFKCSLEYKDGKFD